MNYTGYGSRKKKTKKTVIIITAAILVGIYVLGLTLGRDSEDRMAISEAIEENVRLKQELAAKDERINELSARINELENTPTSTSSPSDDEEDTTPRQGSPRRQTNE